MKTHCLPGLAAKRLRLISDASPLVCGEGGNDADELVCRAAFDAPVTTASEMMWMPGGLHTITPFAGSKGQPITVLVDRAAISAVEEQRQALEAKGKKPFFDHSHNPHDDRASFWPAEFFWRDGERPGIYARGEWSRSGRESVEGKDYRLFSPVFHVDRKVATTPENPARIVNGFKAGLIPSPNMGGLLNSAAFHQISPLWAKDRTGAEPSSPHEPNLTHMTSLELTALENKNKEIQKELDVLKNEKLALKAKEENDALVSAQISAKESEMETNRLKIDFESILAKNKDQGEKIKARNGVDAKAEVKAAVDRGAIAAKDQTTQDFLVLKATEDPSFLPVIKAMQGNAALGGRITVSATALAAREGGSEVRVGREAVGRVLKEYGGILARNAALPLSAATAEEKNNLALEAAAIFAGDFEGGKALLAVPLSEAIKAADFQDAAGNLGLLSGTLVLQSTLSRMQFEYPQINSVFTDFSAAPGLFQQTEMSRIVLTPAVQTYNPAPDASGRPLGWTTVSPAQTVDVPIMLDEYVGIPIVFGQTTLASTTRNLFGEVANQALYALGGYFVRKLMALFTPANYNAYAATSATGGATTQGSATITVTSTAGMYPGQLISGTGIAANSFVKVITGGTTATLNYAATATGNGLTFVLGSTPTKVPNTYSTYAKAMSTFSMADLANIKAAFDTNEVPQSDRSVMLNAQYYAKLSQDPNFNTFFAAMRSPEIITKGTLPELQGFTPMNSPFFPTDNYRTGFAYHKAAAALKSRLPADFTQALPGVPLPGSVTTITDPATGLSLLLVQRVSINGGYAEWMPTVMLGAAVGERRAGLVLTSQ